METYYPPAGTDQLTPEQMERQRAAGAAAVRWDLIRNVVLVIGAGAFVVATLLGYLDLFSSLFR